MVRLRSLLPPRPLQRCHPERSEGCAFLSLITSSLGHRHRSPPAFPNSVPSVFPDLAGVSKSTLKPSTTHAHRSTAPPPARTHSNSRNSFPLIRLLHGSRDTQGMGGPFTTRHSPLPPLESYS